MFFTTSALSAGIRTARPAPTAGNTLASWLALKDNFVLAVDEVGEVVHVCDPVEARASHRFPLTRGHDARQLAHPGTTFSSTR